MLSGSARSPYVDAGWLERRSGEMAARIRDHRWAASGVGELAAWTPALRFAVDLMLSSAQPMFIVWGAARVWLNNDAFVPILGAKHPHALGRPALDVWSEVRDAIAPLFDRVFSGNPVHLQDIALMLDRGRGPQEAHFSFSYTPIHDEDGRVAGLFGTCTETTEQVLAKHRLAAEQSRQRRLFEQAPGFIAILHGPDHVFEFANAEYRGLVGRDELVGRPVRDAIPEVIEQGFLDLLDSVYRTGERHVARRVPLRLRRAGDGRDAEHFLDFIYEPIVDEAGTVTGIFVEGHDVTETHRARSAMRASERRQALLVELNDRFRELDDPADISYAAAEILGRTLRVSRVGYGTIDPAAETITIERDWTAPGIASLAGVLHFRDYGSYIDDLKRGETVVFADAEHDPRTRDRAAALKAIAAQSVVNMPITEQSGLVALLYLNHASAREWSADEIAFIREVAERTRSAVERRRAERDRLALMTSLEQQVAERTAERDRVWRNSRDLLVIVGHDGVVRAVNPAWTAILGEPANEAIGRGYGEFVWPEDVARAHQAFETAASESNLTDFEIRFRHRDGTPRWISWHTAAEGDVVYAYGRDVTAQKAQAVALRQAEEALRQSQRLEAIGQLTGGVAHDFNNLLAVVSNNVHLHRRLSPACEESPQLAAIGRAAETGARLTRQLLAFARRQAIRPEPIALQHELMELRPVLQSSLGGRVEIRVEVAPDTPPIRADRSELQLAIINLAVNARDAMSEGGVLTILARPDPRGPDRAQRMVVIEVSDTGHGIPPEIMSRILEPFFTTKEPGHGTGLGLSQVYGFATQAGGTVDIASRPGVSTTVTLRLPATTETPADPRMAASLAGPLDARVLVAEDNADVGETTRALLEVAGCRVLHVTTGAQAQAYLHANEDAPVDLVLSDVAMPGGLSGVALARWIERERPGLPVILMTGYTTEMAAAREQGFMVLQKPVAPEALLEAIRARLERGAGDRAARASSATAGTR